MSLSGLNIKLSLDTQAFSSGIKNAERQLGQFGKKMSNIGKSMSTYLTLPIAALGTASVMAFDKQSKAVAQMEAGLKSTGGTVGYTSEQLQKMASDLQNNTLFGDEEILQSATAQLLTFTNITGQQFDLAQKSAADLATRLDGDLKSASIMLGKALNDPIKGLSAMGRAGVQFSEEQKEVIKSLWETGHQAEAQSMILAELEKQYGGSAEAAAAAGMGPLKQLQNSLGDLSEEFGKIISEALIPIVDKLKIAVAWFQGLDDSTKRLITVFAGIAAAIGPVIFMIGKLSLAFKALMTTNPILLALTAVVAAIVFVVNKLGGLKNTWELMKAVAVAVAKTIIEYYKTMGLVIYKVFQNLTKTIMAPLQAAALAIKGDFEGAKKVLEDNIVSPFEGINDVVKEGTKNIAGYWQEVKDLREQQLQQADAAKQAAEAQAQLNAVVQQGGTQTGTGKGRQKIEIEKFSSKNTKNLQIPTKIGADELEEEKNRIENSYNQISTFTGEWGAKMRDTAIAFNEQVPHMLKSGLEGIVGSFAEAIGNMASGEMTMQQAFKSILAMVADFAIQFGEMMIGIGVAQLTLETGLSTLNPALAIAGGAAIIALATIAKNFLSKGIDQKATGGLSGGGLTLVGERGPELVNMPRGASIRNATATANMMGDVGTLTTRISGNDLEVILQRTAAKNRRLK